MLSSDVSNLIPFPFILTISPIAFPRARVQGSLRSRVACQYESPSRPDTSPSCPVHPPPAPLTPATTPTRSLLTRHSFSYLRIPPIQSATRVTPPPLSPNAPNSKPPATPRIASHFCAGHRLGRRRARHLGRCRFAWPGRGARPLPHTRDIG